MSSVALFSKVWKLVIACANEAQYLVNSALRDPILKKVTQRSRLMKSIEKTSSDSARLKVATSFETIK